MAERRYPGRVWDLGPFACGSGANLKGALN
jgi:hypothetical protein